MAGTSLLHAADQLRTTLEGAKARMGAVDFPWYPYDSLANAERVARLFGDEEAAFLERARKGGVLDVGCADGHMAFLFESVGCRVVAIDNAVTNHNGMRGVRALRNELGSSIEVHDLDLDGHAPLPAGRFGLALFLGTLYHLRNPFYALDALARCCDYCVMSTRIARKLPGGVDVPPGAPIAYLLDEDELNADNSNYWIFFEPALERMLRRCAWERCASFTLGDSDRSDPVAADERAYYLVRSHYSMSHLRLIEGWHEVERNGSRWTARRFAVGIPPALHARRRMRMQVYVPEVVLDRVGPIRLESNVDGEPLAPADFAATGMHDYERVLPPVTGAAVERVVNFALDKFVAAGELDDRELGVIVSGIEFS